MRSAAVAERLDAARYTRRSKLPPLGATTSTALAAATWRSPCCLVRYHYYYVQPVHGRPTLVVSAAGDPVNLRHVAERSFRDPDAYEVHTDTVILGAVGPAARRVGQAALTCPDRHGWLASNDVMRLAAHTGVRPGAP